jgi:Zn-dependent M32 family carboxypeptidase
VTSKLRAAWQQFQVDAFHARHHQDSEAEALAALAEAHALMEQDSHLHFAHNPTPQQVEQFGEVRRIVYDALLPPVIASLLRRIERLEQQNQHLHQFLDVMVAESATLRSPSRASP